MSNSNRKRKKSEDEIEELNFDEVNMYAIDITSEVIEEFQKTLRKLKREEED